MSITTLALYESLLLYERPVAWWGLDTADPLVDDSGNGYDLTVGTGSPANAASLLTRGDGGASGSRDFTSAGYQAAGTLTDVADGPPTYVGGQSSSIASATTITCYTPPGIEVGDLIVAALVHSTSTATISSAPSGWTQEGTTLNFADGACACYSRVATSAEADVALPFTWTWSGSGNLAVVILVYRNCDPDVSGLVYDFGVQAGEGSNDVLHYTSSETFPAAARLVTMWAFDNSGAATVTLEYGAKDRVTVAEGNTKLVTADYGEEASGSATRWARTNGSCRSGAMLLTVGAAPKVVNDRLDALAANATFHAIIRPDTISGNDFIVGAYQHVGLRLNGGVVTFEYRDGGGVDRTVTGPSVSAATTTHLMVADDGTDIHFWKNGVHTTASRVGSAGYTTPGNLWTVGARYTGAWTDFFDGRLDEVAVWNEALTDDQAQAFYQAFNAGTFGQQVLGTQGAGYLPRVKLEVAWSSLPTADCHAFSDVTGWLRRASPFRGRNYELDRIETGRLDFTLDNRDGDFNPANASGAFYPWVIPTRAVRLRAQATTDGVVYPIFWGYTEGHPQRRSAYGYDDTADFTATDAMKALAQDKVQGTTVRDDELSGARIAAVLSGIQGVPYQGEAGQSLVVGDDLDNLNRLEHAQDVVETEGGILFADRTGTVVFQDRHHRPISEQTSRATYGNGGGAEIPFKELQPLIDEARLFTSATVTPSSGNAKQVTDDAQAAQHFRRTKTVSTLHVDDNEAQAMAEAFAFRYATPRLRIPELVLQPTAAADWADVLDHEISHRVTSVDRPVSGGSYTRDHYIEGIRHDISPQAWLVTLNVSPAELEGEYWTLGVGELGDTSGTTSTALGW